ncbi:protein of unknown function [Hyphomicrobium sp. 1Nfss2.1]
MQASFASTQPFLRLRTGSAFARAATRKPLQAFIMHQCQSQLIATPDSPCTQAHYAMIV